MRRLLIMLMLALAVPAAEVVVIAPDAVYADSQQRARDAVGRGEIRPLDQVLAGVRGSYPGRVMDVDLRQRGNSWTYHIKLLTPDDALLRIVVDASSGSILSVRGGRR